MGLFRGNLGKSDSNGDQVKPDVAAPFIIQISREARFDLRPPGKTFMKAYADYIAHKNSKLGAVGQLEFLRGALKK